MQRRQFLANILFCGGALSVASLTENILAQPDPKEGWELPQDKRKKAQGEDWELPADWKDGGQKPQPQPSSTPPPLEGDVEVPLAGVPRPPRRPDPDEKP